MFDIGEDIKSLDEDTGEFYKLTARYFSMPANLHGQNVYKESLKSLLDRLEKLKTSSKFEELVVMNIESNLRLNDIVLDYMTKKDPGMSVVDFFDKAFGKGAFSYLEGISRNPLYEMRWNHTEKTQERDFSRISPYTENAQSAARELLPQIKDDIIDYGKKKGILPDDFDMTLLLLPPNEGTEYSSWNPKTQVLNLGSYNFNFFPRNGGIIAIPTQAYTTAFHEIIGHAAHQIHSSDMPKSLQFTQEIGCMSATKPITEGVAIYAEEASYGFLLEKGIDKEEIRILQESNALNQQSRIESMLIALAKDREDKEGVDAYQYFMDLLDNHYLAKNITEGKASFTNSWRTIGHVLGPWHIERMKGYVGQDLLEKNHLQKAMLKGAWSWEIYPEAVDYIAREGI